MSSIPQHCQNNDIFQQAWNWSCRAECKSQSSQMYIFSCPLSRWKILVPPKSTTRRTRSYDVRRLAETLSIKLSSDVRRTIQFENSKLKYSKSDIFSTFSSFIFINNSILRFLLFKVCRRRQGLSPRPQKKANHPSIHPPAINSLATPPFFNSTFWLHTICR